MTGDYTKVPLRRDERWTGARMQEGRVLLDHEWNLNLDAAARTAQTAAVDVIGPAGVPEGSDAFKVTALAGPPADLSLGAGHMWVDGLLAYAPTPFTYSSRIRSRRHYPQPESVSSTSRSSPSTSSRPRICSSSSTPPSRRSTARLARAWAIGPTCTRRRPRPATPHSRS